MKRVLLLMTCALMISAAGFAQKSNVNKAKNKAYASENPDYAGAKVLIEEALLNDETKGLANTWFVAGEVYEKSATNGKVEKDAMNAYDYFLKAFELDKLPDAKGNVKPKFTKKVADNMYKLYYSNQLVNYAISKYNSHEYKDAIAAFAKQISIPELEFATLYKNQIEKDSIFYQVAYYQALCAHLDLDTVLAIELYENIRDKGYEENRIHQYLYDLYKQQNDTANFVRILEIGTQRFPEEFFFLGNLINYFVLNGNVDKGIQYLDQAIARDPQNAQFYNVKGRLYEDLGEAETALALFDKSIEVNPALADSWYNKGRLIFNQAVAKESQAFDSKDMKVYNATMDEANEIFKVSMPYFEKAVELAPNEIEYLRNLRSLYYRFQNTDKSFEKKYNDVNDKINNL